MLQKQICSFPVNVTEFCRANWRNCQIAAKSHVIEDQISAPLLSAIIGLMAHRVTESAILHLRRLARTFFGTGSHAPINVRHDGRFLERLRSN
jgi:hypothetical protein